MTLQIYVRYLVSSPCVVTPGGLETKRPVSELYGRSGSPAAPRVTITSSPASAGLSVVRFRTILVWNGFLPLAFVIYLTNGAMGCDDQGRRVSRQDTRVRRTRRTDARFLYQGTNPRRCEAVAAHGRLRRKTHVALGRLSWRGRAVIGFLRASATLDQMRIAARRNLAGRLSGRGRAARCPTRSLPRRVRRVGPRIVPAVKSPKDDLAFPVRGANPRCGR